MTTYLFVTKPKYRPERVEEGIDVPWWSCSRTAEPGDRALVYITGVGILYEWLITSDADREPEWKYVCDVEHLRRFNPPITLSHIRQAVQKDEWAPPYQNFRGLKSIRIPERIAVRIRHLRTESAVVGNE